MSNLCIPMGTLPQKNLREGQKIFFTPFSPVFVPSSIVLSCNFRIYQKGAYILYECKCATITINSQIINKFLKTTYYRIGPLGAKYDRAHCSGVSYFPILIWGGQNQCRIYTGGHPKSHRCQLSYVQIVLTISRCCWTQIQIIITRDQWIDNVTVVPNVYFLSEKNAS